MSTVPIDISQRNPGIPASFRRDSFAHSQGMGGVSWGGMSVGSWLREEVMLNGFTPNTTNKLSMSPEIGPAYFPELEADFCRDYSCCDQQLPTLHDLLRHYEESHITPSPPIESPAIRRMQNMEMVSTNEVFLNQSIIPGGAGAAQSGGGAAGQAGHANQAALHPNNAMHNPNNHMMAASASHAPHSRTGAAGSAAAALQPKNEDDDEDVCIDDPARRLYVIERNDNKPYKCPVIGCDKTYKNQNGLKYHRLHGHQNQTLHLNDDGTYSIIDPLSNTPYPDGMGMEKDKPYRCEICGKRYKNLNGLKYHRAHSTH